LLRCKVVDERCGREIAHRRLRVAHAHECSPQDCGCMLYRVLRHVSQPNKCVCIPGNCIFCSYVNAIQEIPYCRWGNAVVDIMRIVSEPHASGASKTSFCSRLHDLRVQHPMQRQCLRHHRNRSRNRVFVSIEWPNYP
jgi:hypothetical protein